MVLRLVFRGGLIFLFLHDQVHVAVQPHACVYLPPKARLEDRNQVQSCLTLSRFCFRASCFSLVAWLCDQLLYHNTQTTTKTTQHSVLCGSPRAYTLYQRLFALGDHGGPSAVHDVLLFVRRQSTGYELCEVIRHTPPSRRRTGGDIWHHRRLGPNRGLRVSARDDN